MYSTIILRPSLDFKTYCWLSVALLFRKGTRGSSLTAEEKKNKLGLSTCLSQMRIDYYNQEDGYESPDVERPKKKVFCVRCSELKFYVYFVKGALHSYSV